MRIFVFAHPILPGAELSRKAVLVLRHGQQRAHRCNADLVNQLLENGYLDKIGQVEKL